MQPVMPLVLPAVFSLVFGIGVWQVRKRKITPSQILDGVVQALGLGAVLVGVLSIVLMLVASWYRLL